MHGYMKKTVKDSSLVNTLAINQQLNNANTIFLHVINITTDVKMNEEKMKSIHDFYIWKAKNPGKGFREFLQSFGDFKPDKEKKANEEKRK